MRGGPRREVRTDKRFLGYLTHDERVDCLALGDVARHPEGAALLRTGRRADALGVVLGALYRSLALELARRLRPTSAQV